jgi:SanA protein
MKLSEVGFIKLLFRTRAKLALFVFLPTVVAVAAILVSGHYCEQAAAGRIFSSVEAVPKNDVALVLGTGKTTRNGNPNLHFQQRITAAASLYRSGKVQHLLVSGDDHIKTYDEPGDMRDALIAAGVPASAITCDYAGFRTLDSITRAGMVFGLSKFTIVSEEFHCPRAVWIARAHGLDAVAFAAPDVNSARWSLRVKCREYFARAWCGVDLYVLNRGPKFPGPREPIFTASNP